MASEECCSKFKLTLKNFLTRFLSLLFVTSLALLPVIQMYSVEQRSELQLHFEIRFSARLSNTILGTCVLDKTNCE